MILKNRHMSKKLDIVALYLGDYSLLITGREIARRIKVSHQTGLMALNELVREKIFLSKKDGRNINYYLNKTNLGTKQYLQMAEIAKADKFLHNLELKSILEELIPLAETIIVFGSFAKGTEEESSDLDLIMIGAKNKEEVRKKKNIFPREINIEFVTWKEFAETLNKKNALAVEISKNHLAYGNVFNLVNIYCR